MYFEEAEHPAYMWPRLHERSFARGFLQNFKLDEELPLKHNSKQGFQFIPSIFALPNPSTKVELITQHLHTKITPKINDALL